jgi:hypothetical protein
MNAETPNNPLAGFTTQHPATNVEQCVPGWEMIAEGRYQPRRTRGSYVGRVLG